MMKIYFIILLLHLGVTLAPNVFGCGPVFPTRIVTRKDWELLVTPYSDFHHNFRASHAQLPDAFPSLDTKRESDLQKVTTDQDINDFIATVNKLNMPPDLGKQFITDYKQQRNLIVSYEEFLPETKQRDIVSWATDHAQKAPTLLRQFYVYFLGAAYYHFQNYENSLATWNQLLTLPQEQRRARSVWATYMIARTKQESDPESALRYYEMVNDLVKQGNTDSLNLERSAYGRMAMIMWREHRDPMAFSMYLRLGDIESFQYLCDSLDTDVFAGKTREILKPYAGDPNVRRLITDFILSKKNTLSSQFSEAWLQILLADYGAETKQSGQIAWLAYSHGYYELATHWIGFAEETLPIQRVKIKLLLHNGKIDEAIEQLARLVQNLPDDVKYGIIPTHMDDLEHFNSFTAEEVLLGDLGTLYLSRGLFVQAFDALYKGNHIEDAAFMAERILTVEELKNYVDKINSPAEDIRYLLARRLAREGNLEASVKYFPAKLQNDITSYHNALLTGRDTFNQPTARFQALASCARLIHRKGYDLLATEVEPDWRIYDGNYELIPTATERLQKEGDVLTGITEEEKKRTTDLKIQHFKRFHYRYVASDLAWEAAQIKGVTYDNYPEDLALFLCEAGSWLKYKDPQAALPFYKALVTRCPDTTLGQQARELHWFPTCRTR
ncbi:MAG: hypothetical protein OEV64_06335 [Desulfobulbaceae bacterium]|nr:hypothetical protein [Desulfobulbaceae bacterium]